MPDGLDRSSQPAAASDAKDEEAKLSAQRVMVVEARADLAAGRYIDVPVSGIGAFIASLRD